MAKSLSVYFYSFSRHQREASHVQRRTLVRASPQPLASLAKSPHENAKYLFQLSAHQQAKFLQTFPRPHFLVHLLAQPQLHNLTTHQTRHKQLVRDPMERQYPSQKSSVKSRGPAIPNAKKTSLRCRPIPDVLLVGWLRNAQSTFRQMRKA